MDATLYWTKVAAIGQVAGAIATFLAVLVALQLAVSERRFKLRVRARFAQVVDGRGSTPVLSVEVENIGVRTAIVTGFGWTTGYMNRFWILPQILRLQSVFQMPDYEWALNPPFPWELKAGEARSTHIEREHFIEGFAEPAPRDLFRSFPWSRRPMLLRHRLTVSVLTRERVYFGHVERKVTKALESVYRG